MSEEFQKRIFETFEREHNSTSSHIEGSGIGMGITKKACRTHEWNNRSKK